MEDFQLDVLRHLPVELVDQIVSQIDSIHDLCALARTCRVFQRLAEREIYRHVLIRKGAQAMGLEAALVRLPERATWIRSFRNACDSNCFEGLMGHLAEIHSMTNLRHLLVETPDCNSKPPDERRPWLKQQTQYREIFLFATQNEMMLPRLKSCTLHFVDKNSSLYHIGDYSVIFLHPTLEELMISCAHIGLRDTLHVLVRKAKSHSTSLRKLQFIECDFSLEGLYQLLSLPRALTSLTLTEAAHYQTYHKDRLFSGLYPSNCLHAIQKLQPAISHLSLSLHQLERSALFCMPYTDLTPFTALTAVEYTHPYHMHRHAAIHPTPNHCTAAHAGTAYFNLGGPNTTALTYHDIPLECWDRAFAFFTCAFADRARHGIPHLQTLRLVLVDNELTAAPYTDDTEYAKLYARRRLASIRRARVLILKLGYVAHRLDAGIRLIVEWIRPTGKTIPPYLHGEAVPEIRKEFDSQNVEERKVFEAMARVKEEWGANSVLALAAKHGYGDEIVDSLDD